MLSPTFIFQQREYIVPAIMGTQLVVWLMASSRRSCGRIVKSYRYSYRCTRLDLARRGYRSDAERPGMYLDRLPLS